MNYPSELQQKMAADSLIGAARINQGVNTQNETLRQMPQRDKPPVEVSGQRLFERLGQLQVEADLLGDRLGPVSRPDSTAGNASTRAPSECMLVDMLDQAAERVERLIHQLSSARDRLCI
jgi:hypothetical protein